MMLNMREFYYRVISDGGCRGFAIVAEGAIRMNAETPIEASSKICEKLRGAGKTIDGCTIRVAEIAAGEVFSVSPSESCGVS